MNNVSEKFYREWDEIFAILLWCPNQCLCVIGGAEVGAEYNILYELIYSIHILGGVEWGLK